MEVPLGRRLLVSFSSHAITAPYDMPAEEALQAAARRAALSSKEKKLLTAMIWVGALRGWSDPTSHRPGALKLICRPAAGGHMKVPTGLSCPRVSWRTSRNEP
jgi:hypothetical protein